MSYLGSGGTEIDLLQSDILSLKMHTENESAMMVHACNHNTKEPEG